MERRSHRQKEEDRCSEVLDDEVKRTHGGARLTIESRTYRLNEEDKLNGVLHNLLQNDED